MTDQVQWISAREAAELTGIPERVIEWWIRQGRIHQRPRHGNQPTLNRASVEEFARDYLAWKNRPRRPRLPSKQSWYADHYSSAQVQAAAGVSEGTVRGWIRSGDLSAESHPTAGWLRFSPAEVDRLVVDRRRWISTTAAAELIGCTVGEVRGAVHRGAIVSRTVTGRRPGVNRDSAAQYAADRGTRLPRSAGGEHE